MGGVMIKHSIRVSFSLLALMTLLCGGAYPAAVTALAQLLFPASAGGSLLHGHGSALLGQQFSQGRYFWGRLSSTTPPYNAAASGGSNASPANPVLRKAARERIEALRKADPKNKKPIPADLVTSSGSGLDPHISMAAAEYQIPRVARARRMKEEVVLELVKEYRRTPFLGFIGQERVNVVRLNLALDKKIGSRP